VNYKAFLYDVFQLSLNVRTISLQPLSQSDASIMDSHKIDSHNPPETLHLIIEAGVAKSKLPWIDLFVKSFFGGFFIALGGLIDLVVAGGSPSLRASNPALATVIAGFFFPTGFVLILLTNTELATSNFFTMTASTLARRTSPYALVKNWIVTYTLNIAGALFFAGILAWWSDTLQTDAQSSYAVSQAEPRVNVNWGYNFTRGIGCNLLVSLAMYLATSGRDNTSKIYGIYIPIWAFVILGYQHSIANYMNVPIGMFYGTSFGVGKFIWASCIPVTLGNIVGGSVFFGLPMWVMYGRGPAIVNEAGMSGMKAGEDKEEMGRNGTIGNGGAATGHDRNYSHNGANAV
jgi:formate/nitrite transporter